MRILGLFLLVVAPGLAGDWNPKLAAEYLDGRQKEWFAWPKSKSTGGPCISCHTSTSYLMARPALRQRLGAAERTSFETGLMDAMRVRLEKGKEPKSAQALGVEAIHASLFLAREDSRGAMSEQTRQAFDRLWRLQAREGKDKGSWNWFSLNVDPWEMPESRFYGATLAAMAVGSTPVNYRAEVREQVSELVDYLRREQAGQPLHNRVMLLWASVKLPELLSKAERRSLLTEIGRQQQTDGGWTMASLGPFKAHDDAPEAVGSNAYATALVSFVLRRTGVKASTPAVWKSLEWLRANQDRERGYWAASSMNHKYEANSMMEGFMRDAATAFAVMALTGSEGI